MTRAVQSSLEACLFSLAAQVWKELSLSSFWVVCLFFDRLYWEEEMEKDESFLEVYLSSCQLLVGMV